MGCFGAESPSVPGEGGLVDDLLECVEMISLTLPNGALSIRFGDWEEFLSKKLRGGDLGDSMLTAGVSCGEELMCIDIGLLCPDLVGDSLSFFTLAPGVCG